MKGTLKVNPISLARMISMPPRKLQQFFPSALLGLWLAVSMLTAGLAVYHHEKTQESQQRELDFILAAAAGSAKSRVNMMALASMALRAGVTSQGPENIQPESVYAYLRRRDSEKEFPGSSGFGFIRKVEVGQLSQYLQRHLKNPDYPDQFLEFNPNWGKRYIIESIVPAQVHERIHGLDIASDPARRKAADDSSSSGQQRMTSPIRLLRKQEDNSAGFLVLTPVYSDQLLKQTQPTERARVQNTIGWIYAAFSINKLLAHAQLNKDLIAISIVDTTHENHATPVYQSDTTNTDTRFHITASKTLDVFGQQWTFHARPKTALTANFEAAQIQYWQLAIFELCLTLVCLAAYQLVRLQRLKQTQRVRFAATKAIEERRWKDMADSLPQLVWTCTKEGECDYLSARWAQFTGIASDKQLGDKWLMQVHPDDRPALISGWSKAVAQLSAFSSEFRIRRYDGQYVWFDTRATPVFDEHGELSRWVGSNTDIHLQHEAQQEIKAINQHLEELVTSRTQALSASEQKTKQILDMVPSLIGYWNTELRNVFANHAYEAWFGRPPSSIPGMRLEDLLPPEIYEQSIPIIRLVLAGERKQFVNKFPDLNGNGERFGLINLLPDFKEGKVVGFFVSMQDVTEIQKAREAALASSSAKSKFLATVGHEIRNPLNNILGSSVILIDEVSNPSVLENIEGIRDSAKSIRVILDDLLDLAAFESGRLKIEHVDFDLHQSVRQATQLYDSICHKKEVQFQVELEPDQGPLMVKGDPTRFKQIIQNLVSNAVKFTSHGVVHCSVRLQGHGTLSSIRIKVKDSGCGIAPDKISELFTPYVQATSTTYREFGGSGLGLSITKSLVEVMGGKIHVTSQLGAGSIFTVDIPTAQTARTPSNPILSTPETNHKTLGDGLHILVVDDAKTNRRILKKMLEKSSHLVEESDSAVQALELCRKGHYDLIITDLNMPDMDGYQLARQLRVGTSLNRNTPIIALSGCVSEDERQKARIAGVDHHLAKPLDIDELNATVRILFAHGTIENPHLHST